MKNLVFISLLSLIVSSCSTSGNKNRDTINLDDFSDEDFKKVTQVRYKKNQDQFTGLKDENKPVLLSESLGRLGDASDLSAKGVIDEITIACYEKEFEDAFKLIKDKSQEYKRNPIFWNQVGTCFMLKGERRKALLFYNKALEFKASYAPAYNNLGFMYKLENEDQKALVAFTRSKKSNRYARTPLFNLGNLYLEYGLYDQSISTFKGLYNLANKDVDVINGLATAYLMKQDYSQSLNYYKKLNSDFFEKPAFGINYALVLYKTNQQQRARDIITDIDTEKLGLWNQYYSDVKKLVGVK